MIETLFICIWFMVSKDLFRCECHWENGPKPQAVQVYAPPVRDTPKPSRFRGRT